MTVFNILAPNTLLSSILVVPLISNTINSSLSAFDLVRTALAMSFCYISKVRCELELRARERKIKLQSELKEDNQEDAPRQKISRVKSLNTLAMALVDETVSRSSGNTQIELSPKSLKQWQHDMPFLQSPDMTLIPTNVREIAGIKFHMPIRDEDESHVTVEAHDDYSGHELDHENIVNLTLEPYGRIENIGRAFETWNLLRASSLLKEFALREEVPSKGAPWLDLNAALSSSLISSTGKQLTYPIASKSFSELTAYFKINTPTWNQISRALMSANILERLNDSRKAQKIALQAFDKYLA
jgi:hypothetical protein